jgi:hypothetical protein
MVNKDIIEQLAAEELVDANTKHEAKFNSPHEAYAVLLEEVEELKDEVELIDERLHMLWNCVKTDNETPAKSNLGYIKAYAVRAVQEGLQVVAMCDKALKLYD